MLEEVRAESLDEGGGVVGDVARGDFGGESGREGVPALLLEDGNDLGRLRSLAGGESMPACDSYLEVDVLQPTHHDPVQDFLVEVELRVLLQGLRIH